MTYSGRLNAELLDRAIGLGTRVLKLATELEQQGRSRRVIDQLIGAGAGSGAQLFEANEAASTRDFVKTLTWAAKELSETQYWLHVIGGSGWLAIGRLEPLLDETNQQLRIVKTLIARARPAARRKP